MISTVTLSFDLTYTNPATGALEPRGIVTDSTDYAGLGIDLLIAQAKGLGVITFNGDIVEDRNVIGNPMIDLQNWETLNPGITPVFYFPLELDLNGNVANGVYTFQYSLRLNTTATPFDIITIPTENTIVVDGSTPWLVDFLEPGDQITLFNGAPAQAGVVVSAVAFIDPNINITTSTNILSPLYGQIQFDITNVQFSGVFTYSGCTQTTADVSFTYDCEVGDNGSWAVANTTVLKSNEAISGLNCTINYPAWTTLTPTFPGNVVVTSLPYPSAPGTETPLATGTYTVSLTEQIQQTQTDGLILLYTTSTAQEFVVSCSGSLCGLTPCIENLRVAHASELQRNRISKYQVFVDNVLLYYAEAQNYRACGDTAKYRATLELIKQNLDSSGCECACCDENTYYWVSNNSGVSVIESLIQSFQFRLFSLDPPAAGPPPATANETAGVQNGAIWENTNTNILYLCTDNSAPTPTWVEFFDYQETFTAAQISAVPGTNLNTNNVQGQLTQADALFTVIDLNTTAIESDIADLQTGLADLDGINGLTRVGDDFRLGGTLDAATTINCDNGTLTLLGATEVLEVYSVGNQAATITVERAAISTPANNIYIETTTTAGTGADGIGSSILMRSQNAAGSIENTSKIISTWVDATAQSSDIKFTTKLAGVESTGITLNPNSSITLNEYNGPNFEDSAPAYLLGVDASGNVVQAPANARVYAGRTRFSGGAIVISEYGNTTGATISISNSGVGIYTITASSAVFTTNTIAFVQFQGAPGFTTTVVATSSTITIRTYNSAGVLDDAVIGSGSFIKIETYP